VFFDYMFLNMFLQALFSGVGLSRIHRFLLESGRSTSRPKVTHLKVDSLCKLLRVFIVTISIAILD
jgi:hypothetical protein